MNILLYRDDGLGDALFTIPTIKILLDNLNNNDKVFFVNNHSFWIKKVIKDERLIPCGVKEQFNQEFELALFIGPWGKIKNIKHLMKIINTKAEYKFLSSYKSKIIFNILKILKRFLNKKTYFLDFEEIFEGHDIINTFNFVNKSLKMIKYFSLDSYKDRIFHFYDYEVFGDVINNNKVYNRKEDLILHFTYKAFRFGFTMNDYKNLIKRINGDLIVVFGPYEKKYFNSIKGVKKILINNLEDYVDLCLQSKALVGFDTGPVHLASFLNIPFVVSVFPDIGFEYRIKRWYPFSNKSKIFILKYSDLKKGTPFLKESLPIFL